MTDYKSLVSDCDVEIRAGRTHQVAKLLAALNATKVPREWRLPLAEICRRAGLYSLGLTLLRHLVNVERGTGHLQQATHAELAEYSVLLMRIGAVGEALERLQGVDSNHVPDVLLYRAFGQFYRWEFAGAAQDLEEYLRKPLPDYSRLIGKVNLAHAYVESRCFGPARDLLEENIQEAGIKGHFLLQSNCLAMRAQVDLWEGKLADARTTFEQASQLVPSNSKAAGFIGKWRLILQALESRSALTLEDLRVAARKTKDWESLREADLFSLKINFENTRFLHLVFGTPFSGYRQRICTELGYLPDRSIYILGPKASPRLDLRTGEIDGIPTRNQGRKCHQLIEVLLRDFYAPMRLGGVFHELFPGEYFDIGSSPNRVHQILHRTRLWIREMDIPISITENEGFFALELTGKFSFRVPIEREPVDPLTLRLEQISRLFPDEAEFSAKDVQSRLNVSKSTVRHILNFGIQSGRILRMGPQSLTIYKVLSATRSTKVA